MSDSIWGSQHHQQDRIYEMGDLCLALPAQIPGGSYKYMEIKKIGNLDLKTAALRMVRTEEGKALRKDYESHKIHHGFSEYREAEPRPDGLSNTITTVQKDNMIVESALIDDTYKSRDERVYKDYAPSLQSEREGFKIVNIKQATNEGYIPCQVPGVANLSYPDSNTRRGRVVQGGQICPTLTTESIPNVLEEWMWEVDGEVYLIRIRKLTPKECWRLMDFNEGAFEKAQEVNSNTQLYKQAGNSIVVNCLVAIMGQLFEGKGDFYAESIRHRQAESKREIEKAQDPLPGT